MEGLFLFFFLLKGGGERRRNWGGGSSFRASFPSRSTAFVFFRPWATCWRKKQISRPKFLECFSPNQPAPSSAIFWQRREQKSEGQKNKKQGDTLLKQSTRKRGAWRQLLERLVRDFQPLTSVLASSPTWSRQGPGRARAPIWKGKGPSLILWGNCLQVGPQFYNGAELKKEGQREERRERTGSNEGNRLLKEWNESAKARSESD